MIKTSEFRCGVRWLNAGTANYLESRRFSVPSRGGGGRWGRVDPPAVAIYEFVLNTAKKKSFRVGVRKKENRVPEFFMTVVAAS